MTTPGPWKRDPRTWGVLSPTGAPIADVWSVFDLELIVAAPELLEACDVATKLCRYACTPANACGVCDVLFCAMAKAKGASQ